MDCWRLTSVEIDGFRGVASKQSFDFQGRSCLLFGPNGQGKSTIALAIQWALFGKFPSGILQNVASSSFLRSHGNATGAYSVCVTLKRAAHTITIYREAGTKHKRFEIVADGERFSNAYAEEKRDALIGMDADTFSRLIVLNQGRVRGLLMDEASERRTAMDKLLGLDASADIAAEMKPKRFEERAKELVETGRAKLLGLEGEERNLTTLRAEAQEKAREQGFQSHHFTLSGLKKEFADISAAVTQTALEYNVTLGSIPSCDVVENGSRICKAFREAIGTIRREADVLAKIQSLSQQIADVSTLAEQWRHAFSQAENAKHALAEHEAAMGANDFLARKGRELADRLQEAESHLKSARALNALLSDALRCVDAAGSSECPVCEHPGGAGLLRERVRKLSDETTVDLERSRTAASGAISAHDGIKRARATLAEDANQHLRRLEKSRHQAATALGEIGVPDAKLAGRLDELLAAKTTARDKLTKGAKTLENELQKSEQRITAVSERLLPVLLLTTKLAAVEEKRRHVAKGDDGISQKAEKLRLVADRLKELKQILLDAKDEHARVALQTAAPRAQELYSALVDHPFFKTVAIDTEEKAGAVGYCYRVSQGRDTKELVEARLVLSDGQMTAAALALFYALAESSAHVFDLLFIDDPTENLDDRRKLAMAQAVVQMAKRKQVIISTHDEDFHAKLEDAGFKEQAITFRFHDWNGSPQVAAI